jgi:polyhydroxybutyrate depolymerase
MSLRMACEAPHIFAAAAPVIASLPVNLVCIPSQPISILIMNGTEDPLVPWDGGEVHFLRTELGLAWSTHEMVAFWVEANGCDSPPHVEQLPDLDPDDGTRVTREVYSDCDADTKVVFYTVEGGGHTWPGGLQYAPEFFVGRISHDLHAGEAIWRFFEESVP